MVPVLVIVTVTLSRAYKTSYISKPIMPIIPSRVDTLTISSMELYHKRL
jgi:hypothetical protein